MNDTSEKTHGSGKPSRFSIQGFFGCTVLILLPGLAYFGAAYGLGFWNDPNIGRGILIAGICAAYLLFSVVLVMGESVIEDLVKFTFFSLACAVSWNKCEPPMQALLLAVPLGAGLPVMVRLIPKPREG